MKAFNLLYAMMVALAFTSCKPAFHHPVKPANATLGDETPLYNSLKNLPKPNEPLVAAVYKFQDHTGQYKPSENGANWSTAVTQGATAILVRALEESGWFVPIERENLSNLLNERKIIRSSRAQYQENPTPLPPLLFAGIMLEGGIVSYQTNIVTGGIGLRYFGVGASEQYREDKITIYLRAISTSNGKVLKTVHTSKTILSQAVDVGLFRFVSFERLLEAETGYTYNEPADLAVTEAIEKAVIAMVIEGAEDNLWNFSDSTSWENSLVQDFISERNQHTSVDEFAMQTDDDRRGGLNIGTSMGSWLYAGDLPDGNAHFSYSGSLGVNLSPALELSFLVENGRLSTDNILDEEYYSTDILLKWRLMPEYKVGPYLQGGYSWLHTANQFESGSFDSGFEAGVLGVGLEYNLIQNLDLDLTLYNHYNFNDFDIDREVQGIYNDFYWGARVGLKYYLRDWFNNNKSKKKTK